jgi:hypothetical protein
LSIAEAPAGAHDGPKGAFYMLRALLVVCAFVALCAAAQAAEPKSSQPAIEVWKSATCDCCGAWVKHLEANGFAVKVNDASPSALAALKRQAGIGDKLASCHTGKIDGYFVEGHVPATDIKRLIAERPEALGLTVPGMPIGSPGMEQGDETEPYEVLLIDKDGGTEIYAKH